MTPASKRARPARKPEVPELLATLARRGKPVTAAIYRRHGSGDNVFGVLTSEIGKLRRTIGVDHDLAMELWATGNAEARLLALQIADPGKVTRDDAERLLREGPVQFVGCDLVALLARAPIADGIVRDWMKSPDEHTREMGYGILARRLKDTPGAVRDGLAERQLALIEKEIHRSANWARYAMNSALIAIGIYKPALREAALATARRIGRVEVDHGETYCRTPDAISEIEKATRRKRCP